VNEKWRKKASVGILAAVGVYTAFLVYQIVNPPREESASVRDVRAFLVVAGIEADVTLRPDRWLYEATYQGDSIALTYILPASDVFSLEVEPSYFLRHPLDTRQLKLANESQLRARVAEVMTFEGYETTDYRIRSISARERNYAGYPPGTLCYVVNAEVMREGPYRSAIGLRQIRMTFERHQGRLMGYRAEPRILTWYDARGLSPEEAVAHAKQHAPEDLEGFQSHVIKDWTRDGRNPTKWGRSEAHRCYWVTFFKSEGDDLHSYSFAIHAKTGALLRREKVIPHVDHSST